LPSNFEEFQEYQFSNEVYPKMSHHTLNQMPFMNNQTGPTPDLLYGYNNLINPQYQQYHFNPNPNQQYQQHLVSMSQKGLPISQAIQPSNNYLYNNNNTTSNIQLMSRPPVDNLLNLYMNNEGIDRRYSKLIMQELYDATELTKDQLNSAANELIIVNPGQRNNNKQQQQQAAHAASTSTFSSSNQTNQQTIRK
jgi:hypothetical protein